jgi:hypothetical protein
LRGRRELLVNDAYGPEDAAAFMRENYLEELKQSQQKYESQRAAAKERHRGKALEFFEGGELERAAAELHQAHDPLPEARAALEREEQEVLRIYREPVVLVRPSSPDSRDVFHRDDRCGLINGDHRHPDKASWMLLGDAQAAAYRPCARCGTAA